MLFSGGLVFAVCLFCEAAALARMNLAMKSSFSLVVPIPIAGDCIDRKIERERVKLMLMEPPSGSLFFILGPIKPERQGYFMKL
eukprot:m.5082 g.5082  ORF g.5082 m.5082 type:complete len:84 (+) comp12058_c0_seq1:354-605(+)